jgi:hypothetical protein
MAGFTYSSIPTLDSFPYTQDFFRKMKIRQLVTNLIEVALVAAPLLINYILYDNLLNRFAVIAIILSLLNLCLFLCYLLPKVNALFNEDRLYLTRYVLRHKKCKHWVHLDISDFTWDNESYFDPIYSENYRVLNAINAEFPSYRCSECGSEGEFDKIKINNLENDWY